MQGDNAAARLFSLLQEGRRISGATLCRNAWFQLLDTPVGDSLLLMSRLGKVMELPCLIQKDVQEFFPDYSGVSDHWHAQLSHAFSNQNFDHAWSTFINNVDDNTLHAIQTFAMLLGAKLHHKNLDAASISDFRDKISELYSAVLNSTELSEEVKKQLLRHLRLILTGLDEYKITGTLQVFEELEKFVGHMYFDEKYKTEVKSSETGRRVLDLLSAIANSITIAVGLPQLSSSFIPLFK